MPAERVPGAILGDGRATSRDARSRGDVVDNRVPENVNARDRIKYEFLERARAIREVRAILRRLEWLSEKGLSFEACRSVDLRNAQACEQLRHGLAGH
jgi:hypothetical protein